MGITLRRLVAKVAYTAIVERCVPLLAPHQVGVFLSFSEYVIMSKEGIQQDGPLGPLLFSLCVSEVLESCVGEIVVGFLDDFTLGDLSRCS